MVRGFLAEQIVISAVAVNGLPIPGGPFKPSAVRVFQSAATAILTSAPGCRLFVPKPYNYKYVAFLLRSVVEGKRKKKATVTIVAVQSTLQSISAHKQSLDFFASGDYKEWESDVTDRNQFTIEWHFVWVVSKSEAGKAKTLPKTHAKTQGMPAFTEHCLSFESVCAKLKFL